MVRQARLTLQRHLCWAPSEPARQERSGSLRLSREKPRSRRSSPLHAIGAVAVLRACDRKIDRAAFAHDRGPAFLVFLERYSKPHMIEKKKSARAASNASW